MKTLNFIITLCLTALFFSASAQSYLGVHASNYAGVMGTDFNPASFVDGRFVFDLNLGSANINAYTNAGSFNTAGMPKWWSKSFKGDIVGVDDEGNNIMGTELGGTNPYNDWMVPTDLFIDRHVDKNYNENSSQKIGVYNSLQTDVLNFMFHIKPTIAVGFTAKVRSVTNADDVDPKLAMLLEEDFLSDSTAAVQYSTSLWGNDFDEGLLNMNHMTWAEYGVIYSQVLKDDGEHFMKMGGKAKWLSGYTAAYIHTDDFSYNVQNDSTFSDVSGSFSYGHSTGILEGEESTGMPKAASDWGLGLDLGFIYEWRPDWKEYKYDMDGETNIWRRDKEKYKMRAGVSILDIGGMKFQKGALNRDFKIENGTGWDFRAAFDDDEGLTDIDESIDSLITNDPTVSANGDDDGTFFMSTPTAIGLQFDYNIYKWFYVNASGTISVQNRKNPHRVRVANQVSVTPSFDYAWAGLGIPVSYNKYSGVKAGLGARLGPLTVGVTDFKTLFAKGKVRGAEFYAGLRVPILYTHPSDVDGDLVSDDEDECLVVPGVWAFKGCPDTDRDGIKDIEDHCPNEAGLPEFNGCPDMDGDSIPDKDDSCPELFGSKDLDGCPDTDKDGIIDPKDECPEVAGIEKFKGCPDTDGDGIKDSEDACPEVAGPLVNNGCPDTDGDGLFDFIDDCPTEFGPRENNGCPWPDTDKDGLLDKDDQCPNIAGPKANNGCPYTDTDQDGVLDKDDKCPATPGPVENEGCPVIEEEVQEILNTAFDNLEFETGSDVIKEESLPSLTELAEVLVKKEAWKLQIAGHTDNVGSAQGNLVLSKKRSEAVKTFMIGQGIDAGRLSALYFGETVPVADNKTKEGRQKNRRVEMTIIFE
ncbi:MAG: OmpA family protein [Flavobacteriales bacterium]|nr:OmpA family protein [Flavobacteriales bacterium]